MKHILPLVALLSLGSCNMGSELDDLAFLETTVALEEPHLVGFQGRASVTLLVATRETGWTLTCPVWLMCPTDPLNGEQRLVLQTQRMISGEHSFEIRVNSDQGMPLGAVSATLHVFESNGHPAMYEEELVVDGSCQEYSGQPMAQEPCCEDAGTQDNATATRFKAYNEGVVSGDGEIATGAWRTNRGGDMTLRLEVMRAGWHSVNLRGWIQGSGASMVDVRLEMDGDLWGKASYGHSYERVSIARTRGWLEAGEHTLRVVSEVPEKQVMISWVDLDPTPLAFDAQPEVHWRWNASGVTVCALIRDAHPWLDAREGDRFLENDGVSMFLKPPGASRAVRVDVTAAGEARGHLVDTELLEVSHQSEPGAWYSVEFALPWSAIGEAPAPGDFWFANFMTRDVMGAGAQEFERAWLEPRARQQWWYGSSELRGVLVFVPPLHTADAASSR